MTGSAEAFYAARAFLQEHRTDYDTAYRDFAWPEIDEFNFALDHIDAVAADPQRGAQRALWIVEGDGSEAHWTFAELSERSNRVANWLRAQGVALLLTESWTDTQRAWAQAYFATEVEPLLTPIALDPAHPFPRILNKSLNFVAELDGEDAVAPAGHMLAGD